MVLAPDVHCWALALSSAIPHSRDWLSVVPSRQLELHFLDQEFCLCAQDWLEISACSGTSFCPVCSSPSDGTGDHQVGCCGNRDLICRHNSLHDVIFTTAQSTALAPQKEMPSPIPGSSARPADVFLPQWSGGRPVTLDITVISPQELTVAGTAVIQGSALGVDESCKQALHAATCHRVGVNFLPVAVEVLGGWSPFAAAIIRSIGSQAIRHCSLPVSETFGVSVEGQHSNVGHPALAPPIIS